MKPRKPTPSVEIVLSEYTLREGTFNYDISTFVGSRWLNVASGRNTMEKIMDMAAKVLRDAQQDSSRI